MLDISKGFADKVYISHPEYGVGVICDQEANALSTKAWVHFGGQRVELMPASTPCKKWNNPDSRSSEETLVHVSVDSSRIVYLGLEPGNKIDPEYIASASEYELYVEINRLDVYIFSVHNAIKLKVMANKMEYQHDFDQANISASYVVAHTPKFGTEIIVPSDGTGLRTTPAYRCWYDWWDDHIQRTLTPFQRQEIEDAIKSGADYSHLMPRGVWRTAARMVNYIP
jgi:hypothetical protein